MRVFDTNSKKRLLGSVFRTILGILVTLGIWAGVVHFFDIYSFILPSPGQVIDAFVKNKDYLLQNAGITAFETIFGFIVGSAAGAFIAVILWLFPRAAKFIIPPLLVSQALPAFAIAPILVLWLGFGQVTVIAVVFLFIFFAMTSAFYDGLSRFDQGLSDLALHYKVSRLKELWFFRLPSAMSSFASGLRVAAIFAPMGAIVGEWVGGNGGLAKIMLQSSNRMQADLVFAAMILLAAMVLFMRFAVNRLTKVLVPWHPDF